MNKKILGQICGLALIILLAASCTASLPQENAAEPVTYYNDYLGLSITVPDGWIINAVSNNLSLMPGQTGDPQLIEYADGGGRLELLDMQSTAENNSPEHSRFYAYAEIFPEQVELEQYMNFLSILLQSDDSSHSYSIEKQDELPLALHTAQHILLSVHISGQELAYYEEYYVVPFTRSFVVFYLNYWPQNSQSCLAAQTALNNITLPVPTKQQ